MFVRLELIKLACKRPADCKLPFRNVWTLDALQAALARATRFHLSKTEIRRILAVEEIRPHHIRLWLHSPDPEFRPKVRAICNLYLAQPATGDTVLCIDEKTGMQALEHKYPFKPPAQGKPGRREFEYKRHGTRTLFADRDPPLGWREAGKSGSKTECLAFISETWTDLRPRSLREALTANADAPRGADPADSAPAPKDDLVERLSRAQSIQAVLWPEPTLDALRTDLDRGHVFLKFDETGTELGIRLDRTHCELEPALHKASGAVKLTGELVLNYVKVRFDGELDVSTFQGTGRLERLEAPRAAGAA